MSNTTLQTQQKKLQTEQEMYQKLQQQETVAQLKQLQTNHANPDERPVLQTQKASSLSKSEKKAHKKAVKANTFVSPEMMQTSYMQKILASDVTVEGTKMTQQQLFDQVTLHDDYTHMQNLDSVLRNRAATEYIMNSEHRIGVNQSPEDYIDKLKKKYEDNPEQLTTAMMHPLFRMGISCMMNSPEVDQATKDKYRQLDALLNKEIMIATLAKIPHADPDNGISQLDVDKSIRSQRFMMRTMLACHMGRLKKVVKKPPSSENWSGPVANAFAHCSRVMFTLPGSTGGDYKTREGAVHRTFKGDAPFDPRAGATHTMSRKRKSATSKATEIKFFSPRSQNGMNVAVGGLGNNGIPAADGTVRKLKNNGGCGHLYMHYEEGTESKHAGMLIGFESDAYKVMNQTGHVHDKKATGEFASSFGGQRCDEIGEKYGGRVVDLSGVDEYAFADVMTLLDDVTADCFQKGDQATLNKIANTLSGDLMSLQDFEDFLKFLYTCQHMTEDNASSNAISLRSRTRIQDD